MRNATMRDVVVILAGGRATRFPGKLEHTLARVYSNVRSFAPVLISGAGSFSPELDAVLDCPVIVDRWPARGPLSGLISACSETSADRVYAVAGDAPNVDASVLQRLAEAWTHGDEAVVPEHDGRIEPLAALYDRDALVREGRDAIACGDASMHAVLSRLRVRRVAMEADRFANINTPADLEGSL